MFDSRIIVTDNGNYNYTFSAKTPISNQTIKVAKFTMYKSENGQNCSIVFSPDENGFVNSYCEVKDGNYYDLNGNIVSEAEYKTMLTAKTKYTDMENMPNPIGQFGGNPAAVNFSDDIYMQEEDMIDTAADLTQDDKLYLAMKWGRLYKPQE